MSLPVTDEEIARARETEALAGLTENLVSTACPSCNIRFVLLAHFCASGCTLRCVACRWSGAGDLKTLCVSRG